MVNMQVSLEQAALIDRALVHLRCILVFNSNAVNTSILEQMDASHDIMILDSIRLPTYVPEEG